MYKTHTDFEPLEDAQFVWRYMDLTKFLSLLTTSSLYFLRSDLFDDPFEGSASQPLIQVRSKWFESMGAPHGEIVHQQNIKKMREKVYINCWHINTHESAAMWSLYVKSNEGIAVKSNFQRLKNSIESYEFDVYIGKVRYIDYSKDKMPYYIEEESPGISAGYGEHFLNRFVSKRISFQHEQELRMVHQRQANIDGHKQLDMELNLPNEPGVYIPVDIMTLIESVHVSPASEIWYTELVKNLVSRLGFELKVLRSQLDEPALF